MSKKKSPGTDDKELLLAKVLQNAWARDLGWCAGRPYADKYGGTSVPEDATSCCVLGAAWLEPDTHKETYPTFGMVDGNDRLRETWSEFEDHEDVGYAFKQAMTVSDSDPSA